MSEPVVEEYACPECDRTFKMPSHLANHRKAAHDVEPQGRTEKPSRPRPPRPSVGNLEGRIKDSVMMTASVVAIKDPRIYVAVEATVDEFATAWANVAKQNATARRYIESMLTGGVWLTALGATLVMVVTVGAVTGNLPEQLHPLGHFCLGKAGIQVVPAPTVTANGGDPAGAQEAGGS